MKKFILMCLSVVLGSTTLAFANYRSGLNGNSLSNCKRVLPISVIANKKLTSAGAGLLGCAYAEDVQMHFHNNFSYVNLETSTLTNNMYYVIVAGDSFKWANNAFANFTINPTGNFNVYDVFKSTWQASGSNFKDNKLFPNGIFSAGKNNTFTGIGSAFLAMGYAVNHWKTNLIYKKTKTPILINNIKVANISKIKNDKYKITISGTWINKGNSLTWNFNVNAKTGRLTSLSNGWNFS